MPLTEDTPKCYAEIGGKRILDWICESLQKAGIRRIAFIGGYQIDRIRADYPGFVFYENRNWEKNNILASLFHAEAEMEGPFLCSYADILYRPSVVRRAMESPHEITVVVDTDWRARYARRLKHPEEDAEKILADGERVLRIERSISPAEAQGEYIGVARFTASGARRLCEHYRRALNEHNGRPYRGAACFQKAYLIHLFQDMIERGVPIHKVDTAGDYMEIDTTEDYQIAQETWR